VPDNFVTNSGSGGLTFRSIDNSGVEWPISVCAYGSTSPNTIVDLTHGLPVQPQTGATWSVTGTFWQATQPVSAASLPLPTGAAQEGGNLATIAGAITAGKVQDNIAQLGGNAIATGSGVTGTGVQRVTLATDVALPAGTNVLGGVNQNGTWTVQPGNTANTTPWLFKLHDGTNAMAAFFDLDTGAGTQYLPGFNLRISASGGSIEAKGQQTMANSLPVTIASDQSAVPASQSGTWNVTVNAPIAAGTNVIGHVIVDAGTAVIGHVIVDSGTITTVSAVTAITNALPAGTNTIGAVSPAVTTSGGATPGRYLAAAAANQDSTVIKASAGQLYNHVAVVNVNAAIRYLKFYDKATAPTSADTPKLVYGVPGNTAGAGIVLPIPNGIAFANGIAFRMTTGQGDSDATAVTAGDLALSYSYN